MNDIEKLLEIMARLRSPDGGCPWDLEQDFSTIAPYTIEEAYEVADAIERDDMPALRDELGEYFETYKTIHNGVAEMEQADSTLKQIARFLP